MQVTSLTKLSRGRWRVSLDRGQSFCLYTKELSQYNLEEDSELSDADYESIRQDILIPRCKKRGLHLLEKQDRTEANLREKLLESDYPEDIVDIAIDYINQFGYIDEERMARSHIRFYQSSRSRQRIRQDLLGKGISSEVIDRCLEEEYEGDEQSLINSLLVKKHYDPDNHTYEEKAKMYRFLASRGFSSDSINKAIN